LKDTPAKQTGVGEVEKKSKNVLQQSLQRVQRNKDLPEIIVKLYGGLRTSFEKGLRPPEQQVEGIRVSADEPATVRAILKRLRIPEEKVHLVFLDKKRAALSDEIRDAAILHVFPPMAGG